MVNQHLAKRMKYDEAKQDVFLFCNDNKETFYSTGDLVELANLDVTPFGLTMSLHLTHFNYGLKKLRALVGRDFKSFYGVSDYCPTNECFIDWCKSDETCRIRNKNEKIKIFSKKDVLKNLEDIEEPLNDSFS